MDDSHDLGTRTRPPADVAAGPDIRVWCSPATVAAIDAARGRQRYDLIRAALSSAAVRHKAARNAWARRVGISGDRALWIVPPRRPFISPALSVSAETLDAAAVSAAGEG